MRLLQFFPEAVYNDIDGIFIMLKYRFGLGPAGFHQFLISRQKAEIIQNIPAQSQMKIGQLHWGHVGNRGFIL
jgi:hypothetical protein